MVLSRWYWIIPALVLVMGTVLAWVTEVDMAVSREFYDAGHPGGWPTGERPLWVFLYRFGEAPAVLLFSGGLFMLARAGPLGGRLERRSTAILVILALFIGPFLLTNGVFKGYFGRPRPRQVQEFGGDRPFTPVLTPTWRRDENGFPSGHAAAGFAPLVLYFALRRRRPRWAWGALGAGLGFGVLMGAGRVVQGGHFVSDVLWSGGVVYFSAYGVARWQERKSRRDVTLPLGRIPQPVLRFVCVLLGVGVLVLYGARMSLAETREWVLPHPAGETRPCVEITSPPAGSDPWQDPSRSH